MMELRTYQQEAEHAVLNEWDRGVAKTLLVLPTGTGKTVVFAKIAEECVRRGQRVLVLAHRGELLEQASDKIEKCTGFCYNTVMRSLFPYIKCRCTRHFIESLSLSLSLTARLSVEHTVLQKYKAVCEDCTRINYEKKNIGTQKLSLAVVALPLCACTHSGSVSNGQNLSYFRRRAERRV